MFSANATAQILDLHRAGKVRILSVNSATRIRSAPEIPTSIEAGLPGMVAQTTFGIFAPAGIPPAVLEKLASALRTAMARDDVRSRYRAMGVDVMQMSQPQFAAYVRTDYQKWQKVARDGNISVE